MAQSSISASSPVDAHLELEKKTLFMEEDQDSVPWFLLFEIWHKMSIFAPGGKKTMGQTQNNAGLLDHPQLWAKYPNN